MERVLWFMRICFMVFLRMPHDSPPYTPLSSLPPPHLPPSSHLPPSPPLTSPPPPTTPHLHLPSPSLPPTSTSLPPPWIRHDSWNLSMASVSLCYRPMIAPYLVGLRWLVSAPGFDQQWDALEIIDRREDPDDEPPTTVRRTLSQDLLRIFFVHHFGKTILGKDRS